MMPKKSFTEEEARKVADTLGIDWAKTDFDLKDFRKGMDVELEHGLVDPQTNCTGDDPIMTGKIALAHLKEGGEYYELLEKMEKKMELDDVMGDDMHEAEEMGMKIKAANKLRAKMHGEEVDIY